MSSNGSEDNVPVESTRPGRVVVQGIGGMEIEMHDDSHGNSETRGAHDAAAAALVGLGTGKGK